MYNGGMKYRLAASSALLFGLLFFPVVVYAQYTSPSYEVDEIFIGNGGELDACSTAYCSDQITGGTAVGDTESANFRAEGGFGTPGEPTLEFDVSGTNINLGTLTSSTTAAASSNFSVKNYLSNGYVVRIYGSPPTNTTPLTAMAAPAPSSAGVEQFGVNLVANTTPGIGVNPSQAPDSSFSFGTAATGYGTPDNFKYANGDVIALSNEASGETDYTLSMIANISTLSPGGDYNTTLVLQVIATF